MSKFRAAGRRKPRSLIAGACLLIILNACAPEPTPFDEVADVRELMLGVIDPAAEVYWQSVQTIMDLEGTTEIAPRTMAEWQAVRNAALTVAESGNLLLTPGRAEDDARWTALAQAMIESGRAALAAADKRDPAAVFEAGGDLYLVCSECHATFAPEALRSNFLTED
jgi:hypothetical protein